jgi:TonB family protein
MEQFIHFIMRASVYLILFSAAYHVMFRKQEKPGFNRGYLLLTSMAALLLALIPYGSIPVGSTAQTLDLMVIQLPEVVLNAPGLFSDSGHVVSHTISQSAYLPWVYAAVCAMFLLLLGWRLLSLIYLSSLCEHFYCDGAKVVLLPPGYIPFSFYNWIFIPKALVGQPHFDKVFAHERAHYMKRHTVDVIFYELLKVLFWFHPAIYFISREAKLLHEYEADGLALQRFSKADYQNTLLECAMAGKAIAVVNPFNVSPIKKRIMKMNEKTKTARAKNWVKLFVLVPFIGMALLLQSCYNEKTESETIELLPVEIVEPSHQVEENLVEENNDIIFTVVEVMPEYPGGIEAMMKFIAQNIKYPEQAKSNQIEGRVFINFVVEADGSVSGVNVLRGIGGGCDEEAVRVAEMMPRWTPGYQRGQAVRVSFNLPVKFELE